MDRRNKKKRTVKTKKKRESDTKLQIPGLKLEVKKCESAYVGPKKNIYNRKMWNTGVWKMAADTVSMSRVNDIIVLFSNH